MDRRREPPDALTTVCLAQHPRLIRALYGYVADTAMAEECAQEAIVRLCARWGTWRQPDDPAAWLFRVAFNVARSARRRRSIEQRTLRGLPTPQPLAATESPDPTVLQALGRLPHRQRTVIILRYVLDMSAEDTARILTTTPAAVRAAAHRAVTTLRSDPTLSESLILESLDG